MYIVIIMGGASVIMRNRSFLIISVLIIVVLTAAVAGCAREERVGHDNGQLREPSGHGFILPDTNLEVAVRKELNKPGGDLTIEDMTLLVDLLAYDKGISDLRGLEYAENLVDLRLPGNNITDISPIENLPGLYRLHLSENNIEDISPLTGLSYLEDLKLDGNNITDISVLNNISSLRWVDLRDNEIENISCIELQKIPLLGYINLTGNPIDFENKNNKAVIEELDKNVPDTRY